MKIILATMLAGNLAATAVATTLTFDDISSAPVGGIPDGYGGLNWNSFGFIDVIALAPFSGGANGVVSGRYVAYNQFGATATVSSGGFDFNSAYISAVWSDGLSVKVDGYLTGNLLYTTTINPSYYFSTNYLFNYAGIDELRFSSFGGVDAIVEDGGSGTHFAMDNLSVGVNPVPEPSVITLAMISVSVLGLNRRIARIRIS